MLNMLSQVFRSVCQVLIIPFCSYNACNTMPLGRSCLLGWVCGLSCFVMERGENICTSERREGWITIPNPLLCCLLIQ